MQVHFEDRTYCAAVLAILRTDLNNNSDYFLLLVGYLRGENLYVCVITYMSVLETSLTESEKICPFPVYHPYMRNRSDGGHWWIDIVDQQSIIGEAQMVQHLSEGPIVEESIFIGMPTVNGALIDGCRNPDMPQLTDDELGLQDILAENIKEAGKSGDVEESESDDDFDG